MAMLSLGRPTRLPHALRRNRPEAVDFLSRLKAKALFGKVQT